MTSSLDSIYKKMASSLDAGSQEPATEFDPMKHVSPVIAHELNNILTIIQGYAERLLMKRPEETALQPELKLIAEATRRAAIIIRNATPQNLTIPIQQTSPSEPEPTAA